MTGVQTCALPIFVFEHAYPDAVALELLAEAGVELVQFAMDGANA